MPVVSKIIIYPIKGLKGIERSTSLIQREGLEYDRRWMIVDAHGKFVSQRNNPEMALFSTSIDGEEIMVSYKGDQHRFSIHESLTVDISGSVWEHDVQLREVSLQSSEWFSNKLNKPVKLVKQRPDATRVKKYSGREGSTPVSLADGYPILVLGTASVDFLNSKLDRHIDADRFRANIIVDTTEAHMEDAWKILDIGYSQIEIIKPCARCQVVNIDQSTAHSSKEVLMAISAYRNKGNKVFFGANASCLREGSIAVGDEIVIP